MWTVRHTIAPSTTPASVAKGPKKHDDDHKGQLIDIDDLLARAKRLLYVADKHITQLTDSESNDIKVLQQTLDITSSLPDVKNSIRRQLCDVIGKPPKIIKPLSVGLILWGSLLEYDCKIPASCVYSKVMALSLKDDDTYCDANVLVLIGDGSNLTPLRFVKASSSEEVFIFVQANQLSEFSGLPQTLIDHLKHQGVTKYRLFSHTLTHSAGGKWTFRELTQRCESLSHLRVYQPSSPNSASGSSGVIVVLLLLALAAVLMLLLWMWR